MSQRDLIKSEILLLKRRQQVELVNIKDQLNTGLGAVNPIHLLNSVFNETGESAGLKHKLLNSAVGLLMSFLSKKLMFRNSSNPFKNFAGNIVELAIASMVSRNADKIINNGEILFEMLFRSKRKRQ